MSDFELSSTRSENNASGICRGDKYHIRISSFLIQADARTGS